MCLIIHKPKEKKISYLDMVDMSIKNPDGIGMAVLLPELNQVQLFRGFESSEIESFYDLYKQYESREMVIHFRLATHGITGVLNCHPYPITRNESEFYKHEIFVNSAIAHNGIIDTEPEIYNPLLSDSAILAIMLAKMERSARIFTLRTLADNSNRFVYITPGKVQKFGNFINDNGIFYSNDHWKFKYVYKYLNTWKGSDNKKNDTVSIQESFIYCQECGSYLFEKSDQFAGFCKSCQYVMGLITENEFIEFIQSYDQEFHDLGKDIE